MGLGLKNRYPILLYVIDSYSRDLVDHYIKNGKKLELQDWMLQCDTLQKLCDKKHHPMIKAAADTFLKRYSSQILLPKTEKIVDSLESFADYISGATQFIHTLMTAELVLPPFQVDLVIIPNKVIDVLEEVDDDEDDEEDPDSDDEDDEDDEKKDNAYAVIEDINKQLKEAGVVYESLALNQSFKARDFGALFKKFKTKTGQNVDHKEDDVMKFSMPHKQRLCLVADRRKGGKHDELFMYKPDKGGEMPKDKVPEWGIQSSFDCLIPAKYPRQMVTAKTPAKGYMMCFSFKVEQKNEISCHLYSQGQMIRFLPSDIFTMLPKLFHWDNKDKNDRNTRYMNLSDDKKQAFTEKIRLRDAKFEKFQECTRVKD